MGIEDVNKLKQRMVSPNQTRVPQGGGQVSGDVLSAPASQDKTRDLKRGGGVSTGVKSMPEKQAVAEQIVTEAKARDVADSREETRGDERHDLVDTFNPNIPPTIVQERLKMGQHPDTGEPWTRAEEKAWRQDQEDARVQHQKAVAESEQKMRDEQAGPPPTIQPVTHTPISQLTAGQKKAMQAAQDSGASPVRQAQIRDANHPDALGRSMAMANPNETSNDIDQDLERQEIEGVDEPIEVEQDPDEIEADMNKPSTQTKQ